MGRGAYFLALLAVSARIFIPAGFMPRFQAGTGELSLVICTGLGVQTLAIQNESNPAKQRPDKNHASKPCAFASTVIAGGPSSFTFAPTRIRKVAELGIRRAFETGNPFRNEQSYPRAPPALISNAS
jgi:hypothetical protein